MNCAEAVSDPGFEELEQDFSEVMAILREGPLPPPDETPDESVWLAIANGVGGDIGAEANRLDRERSERTAPRSPRWCRWMSEDHEAVVSPS